MQLTKDQSSQFEEFISKIPISKVRSDIERMWSVVKNNGYIMHTEQLDQLKDYNISLPSELQQFIQSFSHWVKNQDGNIKPEEVKPKEVPDAKLGEGVSKTIKKTKVVDKDTNDNSVSEYDDTDNDEAPKQSKGKKKDAEKRTKEAQAGDLHRSVNGMKSHDTARDKKTDDKKKVVIVPAKKIATKVSPKNKK